MLRKNDEAVVIIDGYGYEGEGVGRIDGIPVFVPFAALGETVRIKIVKTASSYMYGKVVEILSPSKERVVPPCPAFKKCGGCSIMHLSYSAQLELKRERVADCFKKIGKLEVEVLPTIASEKQFGYRNKVQLPIGSDENGKAYSGFYAPRSHRIIENRECHLQDEKTREIVPAFLNWMNTNGISAYKEETGKGLVRHLFIRCGYTENGGDEILVMPVISGDNLPETDKLAEKLKTLGVTSLLYNINKRKDNVILGDKTVSVYGEGVISDTLCGNIFKISPESFYQVNRPQAEKLYTLAMSMADIGKDDVVYDLYSGAGTITLCAAKYAGYVYGIEIVPQAVENARENADLNGTENVSFMCGDVAEIARKLKKDSAPDAIILDPPRKGCDQAMLDLLIEIFPKKIVYISCNPATLARDMAFLCSNGYSHGPVQPVDLFPNTSHVECCVLLCRT